MNKSKIFEFLMITLGTTILAVGFYFFLNPFGIITGGFTGVALLIQPILKIQLSVILFILNAIALILGYIFLGKEFFIRTFYATLMYPLIMFVLEHLAQDTLITSHLKEFPLLLSAIFGGILVGAGLGLVIRYNATTGGMDVIQRLINKYAKIPFIVALYATDGLVVLFGLINGIEVGMVAIIAMIITAFILERVAVFGRVSFTFLIITDQAEQIKQDIYSIVDRGVTKIKVIGGYSNEEKDMIMCTLYRQELYALKALVLKHDPKAFTLVLHTKEVVGNGFIRDDLT